MAIASSSVCVGLTVARASSLSSCVKFRSTSAADDETVWVPLACLLGESRSWEDEASRRASIVDAGIFRLVTPPPGLEMTIGTSGRAGDRLLCDEGFKDPARPLGSPSLFLC